jgi:hypothetical protein
VDRDKGTSVALGLSLLWQDYWRAVELEDDDEDIPRFIKESILGSKKADKVAQAIKGLAGRLPQSDTNKERPQEKKVDGSARAAQEKPATRKRPRTPSPGPSTSKKSSGTQKEDNSPARNTRSQRQRKPSKKLRDAV